MTDVVRAANVSLKTVSRVVNEERRVSGPTLSNVQQAIQELGYRRNEHARALRQGRLSPMLGLVTKDVSNHSFLASELALGTPIVFVDRPPCHLDAGTILLDNAGGARAAAGHLLAHGHCRVAFVGDLPEVFTTVERARRYREALAAAGLPFAAELVRLGCHDTGSAEAAMLDLLSQPRPPTAVFTGNNRITFGVLRALAGLARSPALVAFDDLGALRPYVTD
jgi:LacI family transcriptional regulator